MSERPIIFSAPMVKAILEGRKSQTRRIVKLPGYAFGDDPAVILPHSPYGQPGDRLWVRETFCVGYETDPGHFTALPYSGCDEHRKAFYRADGGDPPDEPQRYWKPSIYMPRWASRITLEVTGVRVERLQDISEDDAKAEGMLYNGRYYQGGPHAVIGSKVFSLATQAYRDLWDSLNAKRAPWASNPFVWVIQFVKAVKP